MTLDSKRKDIHLPQGRAFGEDSSYDPEDDLLDSEQIDQNMEETEEEFRSDELEKKKKKRPAA